MGILEYLQDRDITYWDKGKNASRGWINIQCPYCADHSNHLGINPSKQAFNCWMCHEKGDYIKLIRAIENCGFYEAEKILKEFINEEYVSIDKQIEIYNTNTELIWPTGLTKEFPKKVKEYINSRGLNADEIIQIYDLYWGGIHGDFRFRVVMPVKINNEIKTFLGRDVTGKAEKKYYNWPKEKSLLSVKNCLYNIDMVDKTMVIVEGPLDAIKFGEGAVAIFGLDYTQEQIDLVIKKAPKNIVIVFDNEPLAYQVALKLGSQLSPFIPTKVIGLDKGDPKDIGEMSNEQIQQLKNLIKGVIR